MSAFVGTLGAFFLSLFASCVGSGGGSARESDAAISAEKAAEWREQGRPALAARQFEQLATDAAIDDDRAQEVSAWIDAAESWLLDGHANAAEIAVTRAEKSLRELETSSLAYRTAQMRVHCLRGDFALLDGQRREARDWYERALKKAIGPGERDRVAMRLSILAEREGDRRGARSWAGQIARPDALGVTEVRTMLKAAPVAPAPTRPAPAATAASTPTRTPTPTVKLPPTLPRTAWGARRSRANLDRMTPIHRVTVHHTATRLSGTSTRVVGDAIKSFQRQHQDSKGWADIGYHFLIDPAGRIWEGRSLSYQGAHAGSPELNVGNVGIALIGDFTVQQPSASQRKALSDLLEALCARYSIKIGSVFTHQEIRPSETACPGPALQRIVDSWRRQAAGQARP